jgi:hypothetical protein
VRTCAMRAVRRTWPGQTFEKKKKPLACMDCKARYDRGLSSFAAPYTHRYGTAGKNPSERFCP